MSRPGVGVTLEGVPEVTRLLSRFEGDEADRLLRRGLSAGARVLRGTIRAAAPPRIRAGVRSGMPGVAPGTLYRSIRYRTLKKRLGPPAVVVGPMARYRHWAIGGTRPHEIHVRDAAAFPRFLGFRTVVQHPGARGDPWVERGIAAGMDRAMREAADEILRSGGGP